MPTNVPPTVATSVPTSSAPTTIPTFTLSPIPENCGVVLPNTSNINVRSMASGSARLVGTFFSDATYTLNRNFTPTGKFSASDGIWYRISYRGYPDVAGRPGSPGWILGTFVDVSACGGAANIPNVANDDVGYGPAATFDLVTSPDQIAPNPNQIWAPFGECRGKAIEQDWRRCSYEVYVSVYDYLATNGHGGMKLKDVLSIVLIWEVGVYMNGATPTTLSSKQRLLLEAITRNFSQVCADARGVTPNGQLACDMRGMINWLWGLHGWYANYGRPPLQIIDRGGNVNIDFYAPVSAYGLNQSNWLTGNLSNSPFTWGNWKDDPSNTNDSFDRIKTTITTYGDKISPLECGVGLDAAVSCPQDSLFFAEAPLVSGACQYSFAVTIKDHTFGQTSFCSIN